jgi:DNA mismatch repair protein MutS
MGKFLNEEVQTLAKLTPMMQQFKAIKEEYPDTILFFRVGDFYEMFFEDAIIASRELDIVLTSRDGKKENAIPLAGFPHHAAQNYIMKLLDKGYKIAICEQVDTLQQGTGLMKREVTRVITPGTKVEENLLVENRNNYLASIYCLHNEYGLTSVDISTGELEVYFYNDSYNDNPLENVIDEVCRLQPSEIIINETDDERVDLFLKRLGVGGEAFLINKLASFDNNEQPLTLLQEQFPANLLHNSGIMNSLPSLLATANALRYLKKMQKGFLAHIRNIRVYKRVDFLILDAVTMRNLEITETLRSGSKKETLLGILDRTKTAMGGRMLRKWLERPLLAADALELRWQAVGELRDNLMLREKLAVLLKGTYDLERLSGRINLGLAGPRDVLALSKTLNLLPALSQLLQEAKAKQIQLLNEQIPDFTALTKELNAAIKEDAPLTLKEGGIFKKGYNAQVDELREIATNSRRWLLDFEKKEKERTGIKSLKIGYNKVFGYYIEITKANITMVPQDYFRKQTLVNAERFITEELKEKEAIILSAEEKLAALEYQLFEELRLKLVQYTEQLQNTGKVLANLDCFYALADVASAFGYTEPRLSSSDVIRIKGARHPVVEQTQDNPFVPNDLFLDAKERILIITGPNMAGKSTYCRSIAQIILMAQAGSFVPADELEFSPVESIFARVGASDDLSSGRSTFMVEMEETASILSNANPKSLVILDEIGRGTSTYDGMSLAQAILEYLHNELKAKVLFSTHYHELTALEKTLPGIRNYTVSVKEKGEEIVFLRKVVQGKADKSYGINVAKLAGLPDPVIFRAQKILDNIEAEKYRSTPDMQGTNIIEGQLSFFSVIKEKNSVLTKKEQKIIKEILGLKIINLTPLQALNKLYSFQSQLLAGDDTLNG